MTGPSNMKSTIGTPGLGEDRRTPGLGEDRRTPGLGEDRRKRYRKGGRGSKKTGGEGQTPDWIRELFLVVKRGNLENLVR